MSGPLPPEITSPEGIPLFYNPYTGNYTASQSYARRLQRNYARGIPLSEARGHRVAGGLTEYQKRRQLAQAEGFATPYQRAKYGRQFEQQWGFKYSYWLRLRRLFIDQINAMSSPAAQITPALISQEFQNEAILRAVTGVAGKQFIEPQLAHKLTAMQAYRGSNPTPGYMYFITRDGIRPIEWWFYH